MNGKIKSIAIATVFYGGNTHDFFIRYLVSIKKLVKKSNDKFNLSVYLLDNSPKPFLCNYIKNNKIDLPKWISVFEDSSKNGFATGNNYLAFKKIPNEIEYILFLNPDTEVNENLLIEMIKPFDDKKVFSADAKQYPFEHPKLSDKKTGEVSWCSGACLLARADLYRKFGGFDEKFFMYAEDVDLSWKAWSKGFRCVYTPKAICIHNSFGYSKGQLFRQFWMVKNGFLMRYRWGNITDIKSFAKKMMIHVARNLRNFNFKEALNIFKALISGITTAPSFGRVNKKNDQRPEFVKFYDLRYARTKGN